MLSLAIFGGNKMDGSMVEPGERVVALCLFGGIHMDFVSYPPPPATEVIIVSVFGGANLKVRPEQDVRLFGFSFFGGRSIEPRRLPPPAHQQPATRVRDHDDEDFDLPLEITAYAIFGGVSVKREDRKERS